MKEREIGRTLLILYRGSNFCVSKMIGDEICKESLERVVTTYNGGEGEVKVWRR